MQFSFLDPVTKEVVILPIGPTRMGAVIGTKVLSFEPTTLGIVEVPRGRLPVKFSLDGLLPGEFQSIERQSELTPEEIVEKFRGWADAKGATGKKLRFIVTGTDWNIPVFFNSFSPEYSGGGGDIHYSLEMTEFRDFVVKEVKPQSSGKETVRETKPKPKTYTIKKGDTLWAIARKHTGSGAKWTEIWSSFKSTSRSKNPDLIYPGETITIPAAWLK
ncbi:LysM peptidoglycan-binding domain-containing protein [Sporosarcina sp. FSL K6-1508]|uniref:LysM peptidoglycan-binding domain-containing protein n=1 Tax=Sporosarcina sp. FSL K6-1508 TaxID=2921553 RepID=UPI0030FA1B6A